MKKVVILLALALGFALPAAMAQDELDHADIGVFADAYHQPDTSTWFAGLGARAGFNVHPNVQLEAEMNYDFSQVFTEHCVGTCLPVATNRTGLHDITGLFGFKVQKSGNFRPFVTLKGGFIHYTVSAAPATWSSFTSEVSGIRSQNMNGAVYPGAGFEAFKGPLGIRLEVGDVLWFNNGAHNNIRFTGGPQFRF